MSQAVRIVVFTSAISMLFGQPVPKQEPNTFSPVEGRPFQLECPVPTSPLKPEIYWVTEDIRDPTRRDRVLSKRITLSPEGTLYFSNVTQEDANENYKWVCLAQYPEQKDPDVLAAAILTNLTKDDKKNEGELIKQYVSPDTVSVVGQTTELYCIYGGTPLAHPDWFKDGKDVNGLPGDRVTRHNRTAGKRLLIKDTKLEDAGTYTCMLDNGVGPKQSHSIVLTVNPQSTEKPDVAKVIRVVKS